MSKSKSKSKSNTESKTQSLKNISEKLNEHTNMATNTIGEFSEGFLKSLSETSNVAELILSSIHNLIYGVGKNISVLSHTVIKNVGLSVESISKTLGGYVKKIPLVGDHTAHLIEKTGTGVKFVIVPISDLVSMTTNTALDITESIKDVLIFTISTGKKVSAKTLRNAQKTIEKLTSSGQKTVSHIVDKTLVKSVKKSLRKLKIS